VWFVLAAEWPRYVVAGGRYVGRAKDMTAAVQVEMADGRHETIASARIFVSRQVAEREAEVLTAFAGGAARCRAFS
jgi:hypothetical protein